MYDLSVVIPARNEIFLSRTIDDILANSEGKTEVIAVLDGYWTNPPIKDNELVTLIHHTKSVGQRAGTNEAVRLSKSKYIMKCDAHCAFDKGFDVKMMALMQDNYTMVPVMRNLHAFDWVCPEGHRRYQSPSGPCQKCGKETTRDIKWIPKNNPQSTAYRFDTTMHFQYWNEYGRKQQGDLTESMSIQGSCFMVTRDKYLELDLCSEEFNSWGQQGVEVACKTWLSGGRVVINRKTWYAHMFRTQGGDFSFPYENPQSKVNENRELSRELFQRDKWPKATRKFQWLIDKFQPPDWAKSKGILYYTNNKLNMKIARACREQIAKSGLPITSVSLKPINFGKNIHYKGDSSYKTMFKQILTGLESMKEDIVYFAEHDVLYHPSHWQFVPTDENKFYYNGNWWVLRLKDGFAVHYDITPLAGLVAYREPLIKHFKERVALIEKQGFGYYMGFEPMTHKRVKWENWYDFAVFNTKEPNIDLAHDGNLTRKRWRQDQFRRKPKYWVEGKCPSWATDIIKQMG